MIAPKPDAWTIVVVGGWNPKIFTPAWVGKHLISTPMTLDVALAPTPVLRFRSAGLVLFPTPERLIVGVETADAKSVELAEKLALNVVTLLPHTPFLGVGINFGFEDASPEAHLTSLFKTPDHAKVVGAGCTIRDTTITRAVDLAGETVNITLAFVNDRVVIEINFHKSAVSEEVAKLALTGRAETCLNVARKFLSEAYDIHIE